MSDRFAIYTFRKIPTEIQRKHLVRRLEDCGYNLLPLAPTQEGYPKYYIVPREGDNEYPEHFIKNPSFSEN